MHHRITHLWSWFIRLSTAWVPDTAVTMRLRGWLYGLLMKRRGADFQVASRVTINGLENLSVGNHVYLAPNVVVLAALDVTIEDEVMIAFHSLVTDGNQTMENGSYRYGARSNASVSIGRGSWIGANCTVLPDIRMGKGVLVGANSAVTRDVPDYANIGEVPARVLKVATGRVVA